MDAVYRIEGLNCSHCVARVQKALQAKGYAAQVTLNPPQVRVAGSNAPSRSDLAAAVAAAGDYKLGEPVEGGSGSLLSRIRRTLAR
jgi:copper chaperone CopZ